MKTKRPYSFTRSDAKKKMTSIRMDPRTKQRFVQINQILAEHNLPPMSQSEIIEEAVDDLYENLPTKLKNQNDNK